MSTRGAVGFKVNGVTKVTYNHSDSYPSGLGQDTLDFLRKRLKTGSVELLKEQASKIELVKENVKATPAQIKKYIKYADLGVSSQNPSEWYVLLRNLQGDLAGYLDAGVMVDGSAFLKDGLFCEWAYVIDLDKNRFRIYKDGTKLKKSYKLEDLPEDIGING